MPMHDWNAVNSGLFHHFHQGWCWEIGRALNRGQLPEGYTALVEQRSGLKEADVLTVETLDATDATGDESQAGGVAVREKPVTRIVTQSDSSYYADKASRVVIHHRLGRVVAWVEIVSPGNKHDEVSIENFCSKIVEAIRSRIHVLVIDLFPPTKRDPFGIHHRIWSQFEPNESFDLSANQNRVIASYEADGVNTAYIETVGVGEALPQMPLFIAPGAHILLPLEESYSQTWTDTPKSIRQLVS